MYGKKSKMIAEASSFSSFAVAASSNGGGVVFDINHGYNSNNACDTPKAV